jgi:hypothetical protein
MTTYDYCLFAAECIHRAQRSTDEGARAMWLEMAETWTKLAKEDTSQDQQAQPEPLFDWLPS